MASALQLTAAAAIINGVGLAPSANVLTQISTLQQQTPIQTLANIFANVSSSSNVGVVANLSVLLGNIGNGVTKGQWLVDLYPSNVTPTSSNIVVRYLTANANTTSFSKTLTSQVRAPFTYGMAEFANVVQTSYAHAITAFDTISSLYLLKDRTYAQSGVGYTGPLDIATGGIGTDAALLSNVVANWGTMYDVNNINSIGNVYVFGQNLLNQGFGVYGNLEGKLSAAGLNTQNLLNVPRTTTTVTEQDSVVTTSTSIGSIDLPVVTTVETTTVVSGTSSDVLTGIYSTITGANLNAIISGTGIQLPITSTVTSLADFLTLQNIVTPTVYSSLTSIGANNFSTFGPYIQSTLGQGRFKSWATVSEFLLSLQVPSTTYTVTTSATPILSSNTISTIQKAYGVGSGPFTNPVLADYLGAVSGIPYTNELQVLNQGYPALSTSIGLPSLVTVLNTAVNNYLSTNGAVGNTAVISAVNNINNGLKSLPANTLANTTTTSYYTMLTHLTKEVTNLANAGVVFDSLAPSFVTKNFATDFGSFASDSTKIQTYQFFANLVTPDAYGDAVALAITESINSSLLSSVGIKTTTSPNPAAYIVQAAAQNIPLSTYISRNK